MAFSRSLQKGQIPVGCQLCEGGSKIQWKCCDCDVLMCRRCKEQVHSKFKNGNNHRIIDIKEVGQQHSGESIAFSHFNCKQHADQPCCVYCKTCKELICVKCITKTHNGHKFVDEEEFGVKREKVRDTKTITEQKLNNLAKMKEEISKHKKSEHSKYDKSKKDILAQKRAVEKLVEELLSELDDKWKKVSQDLDRKQNEVDKMEKVLLEQNTTIDELIRSKDLVKFFEKTDQIELSMASNFEKNTKYNSMAEFYPGEVTRDNIGTFKIVDTAVEQENKVELKVINQFTSDLQNIQYTAACSDGSLWIGDGESELLQHIQIKGNNIQELLRLNIKVYGMAVTPGDELLISDGESTLKQVSRTGKIRDSQYSVAPLLLTAVHVTSSNTVIIGAKTPGQLLPVTGRRVVIMMDQKGNHLVEYKHDNNNQPLFTYPCSITSTSEGNICVVDMLDIDGRGRVVVLNPTGGVISTYSGHSDINNKIPFIPCHVITTTLNNIVVVDCDTHTIHILDSGGHFITYYSTKDLGIILPYSVALSTTGNLFIGCFSPKGSPDTFRSKLFEVNFSGF